MAVAYGLYQISLRRRKCGEVMCRRTSRFVTVQYEYEGQ